MSENCTNWAGARKTSVSSPILERKMAEMHGGEIAYILYEIAYVGFVQAPVLCGGGQ